MAWFGKKVKKETSKSPSEMSPIESVTYLCTAIQTSDGQIDDEEKSIWIELVTELFPQFSKERANKFFSEAQLSFYSKNSTERNNLLVEIIKRIKDLLDKDQINFLGKKITALVEADGMVMSSEVEVVELIEEHLNIKIKLDAEL